MRVKRVQRRLYAGRADSEEANPASQVLVDAVDALAQRLSAFRRYRLSTFGMASPHDSIAKWLFSQREHATSELRLLLPASLAEEVDFSTLAIESGSFVDEELASSHSDLLFSVKLAGRPAFVYVLFEHQSTVFPLMALRLLGYMVRIWGRYLSDHPDATRLPAIVPVVLHHSATGWTKSTRFHDFIDPPMTEAPDLGQFVPSPAITSAARDPRSVSGADEPAEGNG